MASALCASRTPCLVAASTKAHHRLSGVRAIAPMGVRLAKPRRQVAGERASATTTTAGAASASSIYDFTIQSIDGAEISLSQFKNKVLLIVNVASQCGFTPQYKDLEALQEKFGPTGSFDVLAFPCNQFGSQEPGSSKEIKAFASRQGATFPLMAKIDVNGVGQSPLFAFLKQNQGGLLGSDVKWNFTKFLVNKQGEVVGRYAPTTNPTAIESDIEKLL